MPSCHPDHPWGQEDNSDVTLLNPDQFKLLSSETTLIRGLETELLECIKHTQDLDEPMVKVLKELDAGNRMEGLCCSKDASMYQKTHNSASTSSMPTVMLHHGLACWNLIIAYPLDDRP